MTKPSLAANATDDAYATAMVKCQGYAPACSDAMECLHDGMCFTSSGAGFKGARRSIADMVEAEIDVSTRVWLKLALDALDHHQWLARGAIDAMRVVAINKRVREEYASLHSNGDQL